MKKKNNLQINVMGLGKLGYPMAKFLAKSKYKIKCHDINLNLIKNLKMDESKYLPYEKNLHKLKTKIQFYENASESLSDTDISFITVPTMSNKNGEFSNKNIINVLSSMREFLKNRKKNNPYIIVINSTVSPGSFKDCLKPYMKQNKLEHDKDYVFIYNPYFVALGDVLMTLENPDFILLGSDNHNALTKMQSLYAKIYKSFVSKVMSLEEAELVKLLVNCYVTNKISFTNFVKEIAEKSNINRSKIILDAIGSDSRIGKKYLKPGGPFSGPCFPRDNLALQAYCKKIKSNFDFPKVVQKLNNLSKKKLFSLLKQMSKQKINKIGFLGIAYKPRTDFIENSTSVELINYAIKKKIKVLYFDKYLSSNLKYAKRYDSIDDVLKSCKFIFISYLDSKFSKLENKFIKYKNVVLDIHEIIKSKKIITIQNSKIPDNI